MYKHAMVPYDMLDALHGSFVRKSPEEPYALQTLWCINLLKIVFGL
jgi:hypothetical protein